MKTKPFVFLSFLLILAALSGCSFLTESGEEKNEDLVITIGAYPEGARATFSPYFNDPPLSTFGKITLKVTGAGGDFDFSTAGSSAGESWTVVLTNVPYGTYVLTAKAYLNAGDAETKHVAIGEKTYSFSNGAPNVGITLNVVDSGSGTGTLRYTLKNPDPIGTPINASLNKYTTNPYSISPQATLTVNGTENTITGIPAGYYLLMFGDMAPSVVHIYKDMETVAEETNDIFNLDVLSPDTSVSINLSRSGKIREGTLIMATMSGQYEPNSIKLNGGGDNNYLSGSIDTNNGNGIFTRTFTMPRKSVVVGANKGPTPEIYIDLEDPNQQEKLRFWSTSAIISTASPNQVVTVRAFESYDSLGNPDGAEIPVIVAIWYLDGNFAASNVQTYTVPFDTNANRVGALVYIEGVPHAVDIPIIIP